MIAAAGAASQLLSTLLSKLSSSYAPSSSSSTTAALTSAMQQALPGEKTPPKPAPKPQLSDQTLLALVALQSQNGSDAAAATGSAASADPVQKLFSAMDTDGDGEVSQSEMEAYIQKQGGSQAQADSLFSAIDQTNSASRGSNGISESQMASAMSQAQQVQQAHGGHHHHHHKSGSANDQADTTASSLLQALDGNDDGSVSEDEFSNVITANGGTAADASSDFAALNTGNSNALTSTDFAKAYNAYQTQQNTQSPGSMVVSLLNQLAGASGGAASISA
jgi:Ca2+-binding EF-hand superfamily protein